MAPETDGDLLHRFVEHQSEAAFAGLVGRHVNLVYSVALRQVGDADHAEEIAQAVFIILARKAGELRHERALSSWLFRTTRFTSNNFLRSEHRRQRREQEAYMQYILNEPEDAVWPRIAPLLDTAVGALGETDRRAVVLRFYEGQNLQAVGAALGISETAAEKRVSRALEKLRKFFRKKGLALTAGAIAGAVAANSVQAAPVALPEAIASAATAGGSVAAASTIALVKGTMKSLVWSHLKGVISYAIPALMIGATVLIGMSHQPATGGDTPDNSRLLASSKGSLVVEAKVAAELREPLSDSAIFTLDSWPGGAAVQPDGRIVLGTTLGGLFVDTNSGFLGIWSRGALRINRDGSLDRTFFCDVQSTVSAAQQAKVDLMDNGQILISGRIDSVDHVRRPGFALLQPDGKLDPSFEPWSSLTTNMPGYVFRQSGFYPVARLADGTLGMMSAPLATRSNFLSSYKEIAYVTGPDRKWIQPPTNLLAGTFSRPTALINTLGPVGFDTRPKIQWTNDTPATPRPPIRYGYDLLSGADTPPVWERPFDQWTDHPAAAHGAIVLRALFEELPIEMCRYAVRLPDGGAILAVRERDDVGFPAPGRFMRFDKNWNPDFTFTNAYQADSASELCIKRLKDGKFLVGGLVGKMNGEDFSGLVRLNEDGSIDRAFRCATDNSVYGRVMDIAVEPDGHIVICGFFSTVNGVNLPHVARLNPDGSLDPAFKTAFMTMDEFNRRGLERSPRVPVAQLTKAAVQPANAGTSLPETILITSMRLNDGVAVIQYTGTPNRQSILQARESLNAGEWTNISTNQSTADGSGILSDFNAGQYPMRFYRIAKP